MGSVNGRTVKLFTLENNKGMILKLTDYGAIVHSLIVPDKQENAVDIVLGYDSLKGYLDDPFYIRAVIGRYANRIAKGRISLDNKTCQLSQNINVNHLHGGFDGFDKKIFDTEIFETDNSCGIRFYYFSPEGEEGYPGNLKFGVTYTLSNSNEWSIDYKAETDKTTVVNFTQHTYFNLKGNPEATIESHQLAINAAYFLPTDESQLPLGHKEPVLKTPFDFTTAKEIGQEINSVHPQLKIAKGYDHSYVVNRTDDEFLQHAASVYEPQTGITMRLKTSEPAVHFCSGNYLGKSHSGKSQKPFQMRSGFCLETQHFPDSPNQPSFPNTILKPGVVFRSATVFSFDV